MRLPHLISLHRSARVQQPSTGAAPASPAARRVDAFSTSAVSGPVLPARDDVAVSAAAATAAVGGAVKSPYAMGRIHADGRQMVGENGEAFTWRGVSEFMLPQYLNDPSRSPEEREAIVAGRMDERVKQGYSVLRVFGTLAWDGAKLNPFDDWEGYKANTEKLLSMAQERGLYVEMTAITDVGKSLPREKLGELIDYLADVTRKYPNTFVEIGNESFKNGLSDDEVFSLGKRFKQRAPEVMLAGSSPTGDGSPDGELFGKAPFDYVTLHPERSDGDDGYRWVRHLREGEGVSSATGKPVVQDEPIGSNGTAIPGRRDNVPEHFRDASLVAAITGQGFTFHTERAVTKDPNAPIAEPGVDQTNVSDLIPADNRGTHFVNGHWADSPFDVGNQFDSKVLRVFTRMKNDGSGFWTYPVQVKQDLDLKVKKPTHLKVTDVVSGNVLTDRDYAAGESLIIPKGADVLIAGGNATLGEIKKPIGLLPPVEGAGEPVPPQAALPSQRGPVLGHDAAQAAIARVYRATLGREVDPGGGTGWGDWLERGSYSQVVNGMLQSSEFGDRRSEGLQSGALAGRLYSQLLGRAATVDELTAAVAKINAGQGGQVVQSLLTSPELQAAVGGQSVGPSPVPSRPLPPQRPAPTPRLAGVSPEQAGEQVERLYQAVLGRAADENGRRFYAAMIQRGDLPRVVNALVGSTELKQRQVSVDGMVGSLYQAILDRAPDEGGAAGTAQLIERGALAQRVIDMIRSAEYQANHR